MPESEEQKGDGRSYVTGTLVVRRRVQESLVTSFNHWFVLSIVVEHHPQSLVNVTFIYLFLFMSHSIVY